MMQNQNMPNDEWENLGSRYAASVFGLEVAEQDVIQKSGPLTDEQMEAFRLGFHRKVVSDLNIRVNKLLTDLPSKYVTKMVHALEMEFQNFEIALVNKSLYSLDDE